MEQEKTGVAGDWPAAAATLAAGIGVLVIGLLTSLAAASPEIKDALNFYRPSGALTGKTTLGVISWLVAWGVLHQAWRDREVDYRRVLLVSVALTLLGGLLMFPPIFELFHA